MFQIFISYFKPFPWLCCSLQTSSVLFNRYTLTRIDTPGDTCEKGGIRQQRRHQVARAKLFSTCHTKWQQFFMLKDWNTGNGVRFYYTYIASPLVLHMAWSCNGYTTHTEWKRGGRGRGIGQQLYRGCELYKTGWWETEARGWDYRNNLWGNHLEIVRYVTWRSQEIVCPALMLNY